MSWPLLSPKGRLKVASPERVEELEQEPQSMLGDARRPTDPVSAGPVQMLGSMVWYSERIAVEEYGPRGV